MSAPELTLLLHQIWLAPERAALDEVAPRWAKRLGMVLHTLPTAALADAFCPGQLRQGATLVGAGGEGPKRLLIAVARDRVVGLLAVVPVDARPPEEEIAHLLAIDDSVYARAAVLLAEWEGAPPVADGDLALRWGRVAPGPGSILAQLAAAREDDGCHGALFDRLVSFDLVLRLVAPARLENDVRSALAAGYGVSPDVTESGALLVEQKLDALRWCAPFLRDLLSREGGAQEAVDSHPWLVAARVRSAQVSEWARERWETAPRRVFVSSARGRLDNIREQVRDLCLGLDLLPVMMEYFPATDRPSTALCDELVRSCDGLVLLVGDRYGSIEATTGRSYTENEWLSAAQLPRWLIVFEEGALPPGPASPDAEDADRLARWKARTLRETTAIMVRGPSDPWLARLAASLGGQRWGRG